MSKPRDYNTQAIIIGKIKLGEADRILTLYTPYLGKIRAVAKGVRRPKSKMAGHLELLTHSQVSLVRGRNLDTVIGCQTINSFLPLKSDLYAGSRALYACELVDQFTAEGVESYSPFRLLQETMQHLCLPEGGDFSLRFFEMRLLSAVGYQPELHHCVACQGQLKPAGSAFCPAAGGMVCPQCSHRQPLVYPVSTNTLKALQFLQGESYDVISQFGIGPEVSHQLRGLMRSYIRYLLEREPKSSAWLDTLSTIK